MRIFCLYPVPIECESNKNISKHVDDGRGDIVVLCASSCIATKTTEFRYFFLFLFHFFLFISFFFFFFEVKIWIMHVKIFALVLCLQFLVIITRQKKIVAFEMDGTAHEVASFIDSISQLRVEKK